MRGNDTIFPVAGRTAELGQRGSTLAKLVNEWVAHQSAKKGRDTVREVATVSFHSLRHSAVPLLKAAGVPDATVMALVGHETLAMSSHRTHVGKESLESDVAKLPSLGLAPEVCTPASKDEVEGDNESSGTLKLA